MAAPTRAILALVIASTQTCQDLRQLVSFGTFERKRGCRFIHNTRTSDAYAVKKGTILTVECGLDIHVHSC